jgi:hypothetical protein
MSNENSLAKRLAAIEKRKTLKGTMQQPVKPLSAARANSFALSSFVR